MRAVILAAGYATRMHPLTLDRPKPLLPVGGRPILDRLLDGLAGVDGLGEVIVVTNSRFAGAFGEWARPREGGLPVRVLDDGTSSASGRRGAIGDLRFAIEAAGLREDLLVLAGDNLFPFDLSLLARFARDRGTDAITCYRQRDRARLRRTGVVALGEDGLVLSFAEKPAEPGSEWAVPPLYAFREETIRRELPAYLEAGHDPDAPGSFIEVLCRRRPVHALICAEGPHDIGTPESYREVDRLFGGRG